MSDKGVEEADRLREVAKAARRILADGLHEYEQELDADQFNWSVRKALHALEWWHA